MSLNSVERIIDDKLVLGDRKEIQEVKNANELYENIDEYDWKNEEDFLKAHTLLMKYFEDDNGYYRNHGEAVKKGDEIIYTAPESILVPSLMKSLFKFLNDNISLTEKELTPILGIRNVKTHYNAFKRDVMFTFYDCKDGYEE